MIWSLLNLILVSIGLGVLIGHWATLYDIKCKSEK
jgi:hypothetical protein